MDRPRDIVENPAQVRELYRKLHGWRIKTANTEPKTLAPRSILREKELPQTKLSKKVSNACVLYQYCCITWQG